MQSWNRWYSYPGDYCDEFAMQPPISDQRRAAYPAGALEVRRSLMVVFAYRLPQKIYVTSFLHHHGRVIGQRRDCLAETGDMRYCVGS